ncbi:MAG: SRPBCC family protein [Gammaproteobacteria bacterium]|nr:SRPBCC family protein [Gammaproteobacteria bacterium]
MAINQTVTIKTSPEKIYNALMSAKEFGKVTGAPAEIAQAEGGAFSCFGGQVAGRHLELIPNKRIVQAWRVGAWPEGTYSIVKFEINESGPSTTVDLEHTGFPEGAAEHLESGWHKMYWEPLKAYLE